MNFPLFLFIPCEKRQNLKMEVIHRILPQPALDRGPPWKLSIPYFTLSKAWFQIPRRESKAKTNHPCLKIPHIMWTI